MKRNVMLLLAAAALAWGQEKSTEAPVKNVELTVFMLSGIQAPGDDVPPDLASTVKQLHGLFAYKGYRLAESFILRGRSTPGMQIHNTYTSGLLPVAGVRYDFRYGKIFVSPDKPYMVHIDRLSMALTATSYGRDGKEKNVSVGSIETDLDLAEGQKTVVGKSSINAVGDALILVIVPKVIE